MPLTNDDHHFLQSQARRDQHKETCAAVLTRMFGDRARAEHLAARSVDLTVIHVKREIAAAAALSAAVHASAAAPPEPVAENSFMDKMTDLIFPGAPEQEWQPA